MDAPEFPLEGATKCCSHCQETKPALDFYRKPTGKYGRAGVCKLCTHKQTRERRAKNPDPFRWRERMLRNRDPGKYREAKRLRERERASARKAADPLKAKARRTLQYHLRVGNIVRPEVCEVCGEADPVRIEGHHPDYSKPLEVEWLCSECHGKRHWQFGPSDPNARLSPPTEGKE